MIRPIPGADRNTDVAALSAGVVAVAVTMFMTPGPYVLLNAIVGLTVTTILFAYTFCHMRTFIESLAVAFAISLSFLPVANFLVEVLLSGDILNFVAYGRPFECNDSFRDKVPLPDPLPLECEPGSRVNFAVTGIAWCVLSFIAFIADRLTQPKPQQDVR